MKLGKRPAKYDPRNIKYRALLPRALPEPPPEYDVDIDNQDIWPLPLPVFANDQWGDCVIAGRANQFLRFEKLEQGQLVLPADEEVLVEYWREQGGDSKSRPDNGLFVLESIKSWRSDGWSVGEKKYNIHAFAEINRAKTKEIMSAISLLQGVITGVMLRQGDIDALDRGDIWDITYSPGDYVGGHCMYAVGYTRSGIKFLTWGQRQVATWGWVLARVDEIYGIVDNVDSFLKDSPLQVDVLNSYLNIVTR